MSLVFYEQLAIDSLAGLVTYLTVDSLAGLVTYLTIQPLRFLLRVGFVER